jgi:protease-4
MNKALVPLLSLLAVLAGCSPQIHLDLLGQEKLEEVVLVPSPAREKILMIDVEGTISESGGQGLFSREKNPVAQVYSRLERAAADPSVRAVILRLDTPGGEVTASDIIHHQLLTFKEKTGKPVLGLMMGVAASGGYYIASACDHIMAHPTTLTGSIGVISIFPEIHGLMGLVGVKVNIIKSGENKDAGGPFRDMTVEERKIFQAIIDEYFEDFLSVVAAGRKDKVTIGELRTIADGRVYTAPQALRLKLIDGIGYFDDAYKKTLELAEIKAAKVVSYTYYPKTKTNVYAGRLSDFALLDKTALEATLQRFKSGFYYLWLPQEK